MARGSFDRLHFTGTNHLKSSGFTLLEMMIAISVMVVLAAAAAPSFSSMIESNKVKRLATEIEWLLVQAKSEAVMRGGNTKLYYNNINKSSSNSNAWTIELNDVNGNELSLISKESFPQISICRTFDKEFSEFKKIDGRPTSSGGIVIFSDTNKRVKIIINNNTGRIYSCSIGSDLYGFKACSSGVKDCV